MSSTLQTHLGFEVFFSSFLGVLLFFVLLCGSVFCLWNFNQFLMYWLIYLLLLWRTHIKRYMDKSHNAKMSPQRPLEFGSPRPIRRFRARFEDSDYDCVPPPATSSSSSRQTKSDLRHFATAVSGVFHFNWCSSQRGDVNVKPARGFVCVNSTPA